MKFLGFTAALAAAAMPAPAFSTEADTLLHEVAGAVSAESPFGDFSSLLNRLAA